MKKIISCLLAIVLSIGMIVPSFAATEDIQYDKVGQKMVELGVLEGYPDGSLKLEKNITRAEFVVMVIRALGYNSYLGSVKESFADVPSTYWAKDHIALAKALGLVSGVGGNNFNPDANVTMVEAQAIMIRILGYDLEAKKISWPIGYTIVAANLNLDENIKIHNNIPATRGHIAQLIDNSLTVPFYKDGKEPSKENILTTYLRYTVFNGTITGTYWTDDNLKLNEIKVDNKKYTLADTNAPTLIGEKIQGYVDGDGKVMYLSVVQDSNTVKREVLSIVNENGITFDKTAYKYDKNATIFINGNLAKVTDVKPGMYAKVIIDNSGNITYVYAFAMTKSNMIVSDITDKVLKFKDYATGSPVQYNLSNKHTVVISDEMIGDLSNLHTGEIVSIYARNNDVHVYKINKQPVIGTMESLSSNGVKVNGEVFKLASSVTYSTNNNITVKTASKLSDLTPLLGLNVTIVFGTNNEVVHIYSKYSDSNQATGIVVNKYFTDKQYVQIFNVTNGKVETYNYTDKTNKVADNPLAYNDIVLFGNKDFSVVNISYNSNNITSISKLNYIAEANVQRVYSSYITTDTGTYYITNDSIAVKADAGAKDLSVADWSKIGTAPSIDGVKAIIVPGDNAVKAQYIIITSGYNLIGNDTSYGVVTGMETNLYGEFLIIDTASGEQKINVSITDVSKINAGDLISYRININDMAIDIKTPAKTPGTVKLVVDGSYIQFTDTTNYLPINKNVIVVDKTIKSLKYIDQKVSVSDILAGDTTNYILNKNNEIVFVEITAHQK